MAIAFRAAATATEGTATSKTPGAPAGTAAGDIGVIAAWWEDNLGDEVITVNGGGFTAIRNVYDTSGNPDVRMKVWWKICGAGETGWGVATVNSLWQGCITAAFSTAATAALDTFTATPETNDSGTGTTVTAQSITTAQANAMLVYVACSQGNAPTLPSGMSSAAATSQMRVAYEARASTGATGTRTSTITSAAWRAIMFDFYEVSADTSFPYCELPDLIRPRLVVVAY